MMSKEELKTLVIQSTVPLSRDSPGELEEVSTKLQEYLGRFDTLDGRLYPLSNILSNLSYGQIIIWTSL